jgi:hypothetical protein
MKALKWILGALLLFAILRVIGVIGGASSENSAPRPSQIPAAENVGNMKLPPPTKQDLRNQRKAYAQEFDQNMIEHRIESTTKAIGPDSTTLEITCALASRVMANDVSKNLDWHRLKELGFRKVHLTNGFDGDLHTGFSWDVAKNTE